MNKLPLLLITFLFFSQASLGQKIKSITEFTYRAKKKHGSFIPKRIIWGDWFDRMINFTVYLDRDSNKIELREYEPSKTGDSVSTYTYTRMGYSNKKRVSEMSGYRYSNGDSVSYGYITYKYNQNNSLEINYYKKDGITLSRRIVEKVDTLKHTSISYIYNGENRLREYQKKIYDTLNHTTYEYLYDTAGNIKSYTRTHFVIGPTGNFTTYSSYFIGKAKDTAELVKHAPFSYSEDSVRKDGKILSHYRIAGIISEVERFTYNEKNEIVTYSRQPKDPSKKFPKDYPSLDYIYTYEYDSYGNWTEKKVINRNKNKVLFFVFRKIAYY